MTSEEIYEQISELNYCMAQLNEIMRPMRAELIELSAQFTNYYNRKNRLERQLVEVKTVPMGCSGLKPFKPARSPNELLTVHVETMDEEKLTALLAQIQSRLKGGDK